MAKKDYYQLLEIDRTADGAAIKSAFRKKAMDCHPDRHPGDKAAEARFKELNEAYQVLSDDQKRGAYDRYGHAAFESGMGGGAGGFGDFSFTGSFADIFEEMFGDFMGGRKQGATGRGADMRYNMNITLEEAFFGKDTQIRVPGSAPCGDCNATGSADKSAPSDCSYCHGSGKVRSNQGFFMVERTCQVCGGAGQVIAKPCKTCVGAGRVRREKTLSVNIPSGVEDGTRIRLSGEGEPGMRGGNPGDLYIFLSVSPHRIFKRDGANLFAQIPIPMTHAALGGVVDIPTIDGKIHKLQIPAGSQYGQQFRIKGQGMNVMRAKSRGDFFVELKIETPVQLNKKQQQLLREFQESLDPKSNPESHRFAKDAREFAESGE